MKPVRQRPIKRPDGTLSFSPPDPAMNRRATLGHSSGMTEFLKRVFAEALLIVRATRKPFFLTSEYTSIRVKELLDRQPSL